MLQLHGLERIPWLWIALHKQIFRWIFIVYFYLIILRCKITSDASCFGKRFLSLIPHAKYKMYFSFVFCVFIFNLSCFCSLTSVLYKLVSMQFILSVNSRSLFRVSLSDHSTGKSCRTRQFFLVTWFHIIGLFCPLSIKYILVWKQNCH